ncbi:MAG: type II toxin-antitoxin system PemK/MazF family toxin [Myxococcaceae bacterium]
MIERGELWWADLVDPLGSAPGYRRPVVVVQANSVNASSINTVIVLAVTSNVRLANAPGNVFLPKGKTRLPADSVANVSQVATIDKATLSRRVAVLPVDLMRRIDVGLRRILSL